MPKDTAVVTLNIEKRGLLEEIEIPLHITANDLIIALNSAYQLGINTEDVFLCYLKSENPIALLKGNKKLEEFGIRNGSLLIID